MPARPMPTPSWPVSLCKPESPYRRVVGGEDLAYRWTPPDIVHVPGLSLASLSSTGYHQPRAGRTTMPISILVEPAANGYRAITGGPLDLAAEGATPADAVAALNAKIANRMRGGAVLIEQSVAPSPPIAVLPLAENPLFDDWLGAVEDYRTQRDLEERAATGDAG